MTKSERKKLLNKLDFDDIINQLHYGLSICNDKGEMLYVSESYEKIYNIRIEDIIGKSNSDVMATKKPVSDVVLEMGKKITTKQENQYGDEMFVTGVPIFDTRERWSMLLHEYDFKKQLQSRNSTK